MQYDIMIVVSQQLLKSHRQKLMQATGRRRHACYVVNCPPCCTIQAMYLTIFAMVYDDTIKNDLFSLLMD